MTTSLALVSNPTAADGTPDLLSSYLGRQLNGGENKPSLSLSVMFRGDVLLKGGRA